MKTFHLNVTSLNCFSLHSTRQVAQRINPAYRDVRTWDNAEAWDNSEGWNAPVETT